MLLQVLVPVKETILKVCIIFSITKAEKLFNLNVLTRMIFINKMQHMYYLRPLIPRMWARQMQRRLLKMHSRKQLRSIKGMRHTLKQPMVMIIGEKIYHKHHGFRTNFSYISIQVMSLNVWGLPGALGAPYKTERIKAIAEEISKGEFDIYLLQELWMQADHEAIHSKIPNAFFMTRFRELASSWCEGRWLPTCK